MIPTHHLRQDDRAVAVSVNHVLAIGITAILLVGLLTAAGGLAKDETRDSTRQQLRMVGSQMAHQMERVDRLSRQGANVTVEKDYIPMIAGANYDVSFENGSMCDVPSVDANTCLVLKSVTSDVSVTVGVGIRSSVAFDYRGSGTVRVHSLASGTTGDSPIDPMMVTKIGVGEAVYDNSPGTGKQVFVSLPPVATFELETNQPQYNDIVVLNASGSYDRDKGNITEYKWDLDNDGSFDQVTTSPTVGFLATDSYLGRNQVRMKVVDDESETNSTMNSFKVSGTRLTSKVGSFHSSELPEAHDYDGDGVAGGLWFEIINKHPSDYAVVDSIVIQPDSPSIDKLRDELDITADGDSYIDPGETELLLHSKTHDDYSWINYDTDTDRYDCEFGTDKEGFTIPDGGVIQNLTTMGKADWEYDGGYTHCVDKNGGEVEFAPGEKGDVWLAEFEAGGAEVDVSDKNISVGFLYTLEGEDTRLYSEVDVNPLKPIAIEQPSVLHQSVPGTKNKINLNIKQQNVQGTLHAEWELIANPYDINITKADLVDKNGKNDTRTLYIAGGSTPVDPSIHDKYVIVEVTIWDQNGQDTVRYIIEVNDTDGEVA